MNARQARVIRAGIEDAQLIIGGDASPLLREYWSRSRNRLWFRAYWRTLHRDRIRTSTRRMMTNLFGVSAGFAGGTFNHTMQQIPAIRKALTISGARR